MKIYSSISSCLLILLCVLNSAAMDEFLPIGFDNKTSIFDFYPISQAKEDADVENFFFSLKAFREVQKKRKEKKRIRVKVCSNEDIKIIPVKQSEE
jgi:hypothetical protein